MPSLGRRLSARPRDAEAWADLTLAAASERGNLMRMAALLELPPRTMQHLHQHNAGVRAVVEYHRRGYGTGGSPSRSGSSSEGTA